MVLASRNKQEPMLMTGIFGCKRKGMVVVAKKKEIRLILRLPYTFA